MNNDSMPLPANGNPDSVQTPTLAARYFFDPIAAPDADFKIACDLLTQMVADATGFPQVVFCLFDAQGSLRIAAQSGLVTPGAADGFDSGRALVDFCQQHISTEFQQATVANTTPTTVPPFPFNFVACMPVMDGDQCPGAFFVVSSAPQQLTPAQMKQLSTIASLARQMLRSEMHVRQSHQQNARLKQQSEERYRETPAMLHSIDAEGRIVKVSNLWCSVMGYEREEVLGKKSSDFLTQASRRYAIEVVFPEYARSGGVSDIAYQMLKKNGDVIDVLMSASSESDANGVFVRSRAVIVDVTEIKRANLYAKTLLDRLTVATQAIALGVWEFDLASQQLSWDDKMYQLYEVDRALPLTYETWRQRLLPEDLVATEAAIDQAFERGATYEGHFRIVNPAGKIRWIRSAITRQSDANGTPLRMIGVNWDDTEAVLAQQALNRAGTEMQTIIDHMPALVVYWDTDLHNRFANSGYIEWFGITPEQMRGKHITEVIGIERFKLIEPFLVSVLQGQAVVFEQTIEHPNGVKRHVLFSYVPDIEDGEVKGIYGFLSDISQLRQAQVAKDEALAELQSVLDAASDFSIIAGDNSGTITIFSKGAERMLGYSAAEMLSQQTAIVIHDLDEVKARSAELTELLGKPVQGIEVFVAMVGKNRSESREWTYIRKDGKRIPVNLTVAERHDANGNRIGSVGIAKDISVDKAAMLALASARDQAEAANIAKSQFLANMSHEIRTPMNAILGMLQLMQHTTLLPRQYDYVVKAQTAARSLLGLLNDILDFSKVEAGKMVLERRVFRFEALMRELAVLLGNSMGSKNIEVLFAIDPKLPSAVVGDVFRLQQVLLNLAGNAVKFTEDGEVVVSVQVAERSSASTLLEFSVQDSGIGITPEHLAFIFEGFSQAEASTTRRFGGTGLGLAISQRLVGLMGGNLQVESEVGAGSRFFFSVAFENAVEVTPAPTPLRSVKASQLNGLRVLIVDDNRSARTVLSAMVESLGWSAYLATDGATALALLQESDASNYDVIFVDWKMPGMDGWETTYQIRQLKHKGPAPIIIMVTAHDSEALSQRWQSGQDLINGFLVKPVTTSMLFDTVSMASAGAPARSLTQQAANVGSMPQRLAGLRLLVVEDNFINQQVALELLANEGAIVEVAGGGVVGVQMSIATDPSFDAILMDIQMPDMDGYTATRMIRRYPHCQSLPVIAMTANAMSSDLDACFAAGMNDHIAKPIDLDKLVQTILLHCSKNLLPENTLPEGALGLAAQLLTPSVAPAVTPEQVRIDVDAALKRFGNNQALFLKLTTCFGTDTAVMADNLAGHLASGDSAAAASVLHTLKGVAATMGAQQLADFAAGLELKINQGEQLADTGAILTQMRARITATRIALEKAADALRLNSQTSQTPASKGIENPPETPPQSPPNPVIDPVSLNAALAQFEDLLQGSDLRAIHHLAQIRQQYAIAPERLLRLNSAMDRLDFKQAIVECRALRQGN